MKGGGEDKLARRLSYADAFNFLHFEKTPKVILFTSGEKTVPSWFTSVAVKFKVGRCNFKPVLKGPGLTA